MSDFSRTSQSISPMLDALAEIVQYPLIDNKAYFDSCLWLYERSVDSNCGFTSDLARESASKAIKVLSSYLLNPTPGNYVYLQRCLLEYEVKYSVNREYEVQEHES